MTSLLDASSVCSCQLNARIDSLASNTSGLVNRETCHKTPHLNVFLRDYHIILSIEPTSGISSAFRDNRPFQAKDIRGYSISSSR